jgi:hypothetical protein
MTSDFYTYVCAFMHLPDRVVVYEDYFTPEKLSKALHVHKSLMMFTSSSS